MDNKQVEELIEKLVQERDQFVDEFNRSPMIVQANNHIAYLNGQIDGLKKLLAPDEAAVVPD